MALLGAHTLGKCTAANSGYRGPWLVNRDTSTFDNKYFQTIRDQSIEYVGLVSHFIFLYCGQITKT